MDKRALAAILAATLSIACRREAPAPETGKPVSTSAAAVAQPQDASTADVNVAVPLTATQVAQCSGLQAVYRRNEPIVLTLDLKEAPEALQVTARILDGDRKPVAQASEEAASKKSVTLTIRDDIPAGKYMIEGLWGGNVVCESAIEITAGAASR